MPIGTDKRPFENEKALIVSARQLTRKPWLIGTLALVVIIFALLTYSMSIPPYYQICTEADDTKPPHCTTYHIAPFIFLKTSEFFESYNGAITAFATFVIACFTATLWFVTYKQSRLTQQSIDISRAEFIVTHRPRLRIRRIWPVGKTTFLNNTGTNIRIIVANIREAEARVTQLTTNMVFERDKTRRGFFQADTTTSQYGDKPIVVMRGKQAIIDATATLDINPIIYDHNARGRQYEAIAIGVVEYEDALGGKYLTGFSRLYDPDSNRFQVVPKDDPEADREYED